MTDNPFAKKPKKGAAAAVAPVVHAGEFENAIQAADSLLASAVGTERDEVRARINGVTMQNTRHQSIVVTTRRLRDWFRWRYWVRCWDCNLRDGPFVSKSLATIAAAGLDGPTLSRRRTLVQAILTLTPQAAVYARRIETVGAVKHLARKVAINEAAILRDYRRREWLGQSLTPLNRQAALRVRVSTPDGVRL
jgi:hypothetical protein